ncbi:MULTISPECIES: hypothetical protein [unclassified Streptomyces]|uniref:hypothetical protein n=1 Tax=unclassified Streptomyces TaxID=2593676 RepID=UPI00344CD654
MTRVTVATQPPISSRATTSRIHGHVRRLFGGAAGGGSDQPPTGPATYDRPLSCDRLL